MIQTKKALKQAQLKESLDALRALSDTDQAVLVAAQNSAGRGVVMVTGHTPSIRNCAFLYLQSHGKPLSIVGGFRQWETAGRRVRRGRPGPGGARGAVRHQLSLAAAGHRSPPPVPAPPLPPPAVGPADVSATQTAHGPAAHC